MIYVYKQAWILITFKELFYQKKKIFLFETQIISKLQTDGIRVLSILSFV